MTKEQLEHIKWAISNSGMDFSRMRPLNQALDELCMNDEIKIGEDELLREPLEMIIEAIKSLHHKYDFSIDEIVSSVCALIKSKITQLP